MASGSSNRASNSGSKGFDFASDDILCSYDDFSNQDKANENHSDPVVGSISTKQEFQKNRMTRSSIFPTPAYSPPEESPMDQDVSAIVEKTMKKYADNLMRFLEGISSRLSQLELYCYNLDKSIGEMRSELVSSNAEANSKLKSIEKNLQEVHRSVQILRDKQELVEAQKELAKLQLAQQKESSQENEERTKQQPPVSSDTINRGDSNPSEAHEKQLALALPPQQQQQQQQPVQPPPPPIPSQGYYMPQPQMPQPPPNQFLPHQNQYLPSDSQQYTRPPPPQTLQSQVVPSYQQQWVPQPPPPMQQQQARPPSSQPIYPSYQSSPTAQEIPSTFSVASRPEGGVPYGYGRPAQQQAPAQHIRPAFGGTGDSYVVSGPHTSLGQGSGYAMYDGGVPHGGYPQQPASTSNVMARPVAPPPQLMRSHPYNELVEKMVGMGYRGDHVVSAIQRLEESSQAVDFNAILDRLNGHSSGGSQRSW
ncbi:hypothetical protein DM860_003814 [Cuscuta australis]|uniref:DUF1421 domain-containing protein n=1 Tax=Cuscuta australis TaxID=267555 RepID=A0A328DGV5_9ASTE|nr:hypothetical protein DM860_003814 [Cuscuta australis]